MKIKYIKPIVLLSVLSQATFGGSTDSFLLNHTHPEVLELINDSREIKLENVRSICHYLTDEDIILAKGKYPFPKRKKAFKRHVKEVCEEVELSHWLGEKADTRVENFLYELLFLKKSMDQKAEDEIRGLGFLSKIMMGFNSVFKKNDFKYKNRVEKNESQNLQTDRALRDYSAKELSEIDPVDSPFWQRLPDTIRPFERFDQLAKNKKIKPKKKEIVLLFDGVSGSGSAPKVKTLDTNLDDEWSLKWGDELHTDVVGSRIFAGLGFDVDHPFHKKKDRVILVFPKKDGQSQNAAEMVAQVKTNFKIDISKFVNNVGIVSDEMVMNEKKLAPYVGLPYVTFVKSAIEGRPDRVKRLGPIMDKELGNRKRRELRGSLLAHLWIDNWDTRLENTMLALNHEGKRVYHVSGAFSDLGTSLGVKVSFLPKTDFRVGLVNSFDWDIVDKKSSKEKVRFKGQINSFLGPYKKATYADLRWMALKIAKFSGDDLEEILKNSGWPKGIEKLYFYKLANRRAQILEVFDVKDPHPIEIDKNYSYSKDGVDYIKNGILIKDFPESDHPLGFLNKKGRLRNYGQNKKTNRSSK